MLRVVQALGAHQMAYICHSSDACQVNVPCNHASCTFSKEVWHMKTNRKIHVPADFSGSTC